MLKPRALRPDDRIAVVAPASPLDRDEFFVGIAELERLGFKPVYDDSVFAQEGYVAGSATLRRDALRRAWQDPSVAGVVAVRGGYGSVQALPWLSTDEIRETPKAFIGYSDLTTILTHLTINCGLVCFHGPMLDRRLSRGEQGYDRASFLNCVTKPEPAGELQAPKLETLKTGDADAPLLGGNLTQLIASLGTPYAFRPAGPYVLFLEEVSERPYRLDRMVTQLRLSGALTTAVAVVIGELQNCDEPGGEYTGRSTMASLFRDFPGPVVFGFPSGHTTGALVTLPLGVRVRVAATSQARVIVEEAAVA
ncbi:MAG TPA: LD-carboxypeptidase [Vicinamibacterales bacterium]|jgi:muramoyltetrapeptide carboxypeptidase